MSLTTVAITREIVSVNFNTSFGFLKKAVTPARHASRSQSVAESSGVPCESVGVPRARRGDTHGTGDQP
jgi:hypothetical protein